MDDYKSHLRDYYSSCALHDPVYVCLMPGYSPQGTGNRRVDGLSRATRQDQTLAPG